MKGPPPGHWYRPLVICDRPLLDINADWTMKLGLEQGTAESESESLKTIIKESWLKSTTRYGHVQSSEQMLLVHRTGTKLHEITNYYYSLLQITNSYFAL